MQIQQQIKTKLKKELVNWMTELNELHRIWHRFYMLEYRGYMQNV